jgi:hypothetical protein
MIAIPTGSYAGTLNISGPLLLVARRVDHPAGPTPRRLSQQLGKPEYQSHPGQHRGHAQS